MNDSVQLIHRVKEQVLVLLAARADVEEAMKSSGDRYELCEMLRPILRGIIARQSIRLNRREYFAVEGLIVDELVSSTKGVPLVNVTRNAADEHIAQTVSDFPIVAEMSQFASFPEASQRYICEALAIGLNPSGPIVAGTLEDAAVHMARADVYSSMPKVRELIGAKDYVLETWSAEFGLLHRYARFDVQYDEMADFTAFVFLYERLLGPAVRPWLLSIYLAAAGSPLITEEGREERLSRLTAYDVAHDFVDLPAPKYFPTLD